MSVAAVIADGDDGKREARTVRGLVVIFFDPAESLCLGGRAHPYALPSYLLRDRDPAAILLPPQAISAWHDP
tara:strand:- start:81246 stop:81461 length:216 start_codon:yes stop_codon:yes gene_type:complete